MKKKTENKEVLIGKQGRDTLLRGSQLLYDGVSVTLGAKGQNVIIKQGLNGEPFITKDGVTVANNITSNDVFVQGAIDVIIRAASDTNKVAGDGTTTSIVLAHSIFKEGYSRINNKWKKKVNSIGVQRGILKAADIVKEKLTEMASYDFTSKDVAMISANGDDKVASIVSEAFNLVGSSGVVNIEKSPSTESYVTKDDGLKINSPIIHEGLITDNKNMSSSQKDPKVVVVDDTIENMSLIFYYIMGASNINKPITIIAHDFGKEVINAAVNIKTTGHGQVLLVKAPFYGEQRSTFLKDIAVMTKATLIGETEGNIKTYGLKLHGDNKQKAASSLKLMGEVAKIESSRESTFIKYDIDDECNKYIEKLMSVTEKDDFLNRRIAMLTGKIATINVGGSSSTEVDEKIDRVEDAKNAVRAALTSGIVAGGGRALDCAKNVINDIEFDSYDEFIGGRILYKVLSQPAKKILENGGYKYSKEKYPYGVDVKTGEVVDLIEKGIIDPVSVTMSALSNATSVAASLLTSQAYVLNIVR